MTTLFHPPSGFRIPEHSDWEISSSYDKKPTLFWRGEGTYTYKTTGKDAWVTEEVPAPPREPDRHFRPDEEWAAWREEWQAYVEKWGAPCASVGTNMCGLYKVRATLDMLSGGSLNPPADIQDRFQRAFNVTLFAFQCTLLFGISAGFSFDLFKFLRAVMQQKGDSFEAFEEREESAKDWLIKHYGTDASAAVEALTSWRPTEEQYAAHHKVRNDYCKQRDAAMDTCKKRNH